MAFACSPPTGTRSAFPPATKSAMRRHRPASASRPQRVAAPLSMAGNEATFSTPPDASKMRIGIVSSRWNSELVQPMVEQVTATLKEAGVQSENVVTMQVPGAFELPMATRLMCASQKVDAVVCLGVLIKGETDHYEYIANAVSTGIMDLQLTTLIPIVFGVLTCRTKAQAEARSTGDKAEAGTWAKTAVEMAGLRASQVGGVSAGKKSVGFF